MLLEVDRIWWARVIRRAGVVDLDFVAAQAGHSSERRAVRSYVRGGFRNGMSLNPLFTEKLVSSQLPDAGRVPALYAYLVNDPRRVQVSVSWDAPAYAAANPETLSARGGPLGHAWRTASSSNAPVLVFGRPPGPQRDVTWREVLSAAVAGVRAAEQPAARAIGALTRKVIVVCRLAEDEANSSAPLNSVVSVASEIDADVIVAVGGHAPDEWSAAVQLELWLPGVHVVEDQQRLLDRLRAVAPSDATLVVRGPHAEIDPPDLLALARLGAERPAAPLWLGWDGAIVSAGTIARNGHTWHFLEGHPEEDARRIGETLDVHEVSGETFAVPVGQVTSGARTALTLTVRAPASAVDGRPTDAHDSDILPALHALSLDIGQSTTYGFRYSRRRTTVTLADGSSVPSLRWAIKIAAPPGRPGENWGDTHFARGIADALRLLGQEVVIDAYDARARAGVYLDDVVLALRGPEPITSQPGALSLLWIISHPDEIVSADVDGFDRIFAASASWAQAASRTLGRRIDPLLQCTDVRRFRPSGAVRTQELVFVGTARGIERPSVVEPIRAGIPVSVYGPDWRGYIPAERIVATSVPNSELPVLYESAAAVLNDHWPAMRAAGFVSNRLFDVVAAGGRAVSDEVAGIAEIFDGAVATYRTIPELLMLLRGDLDAIFPGEDGLATISERVRREHSFDARARTLLDAALADL
ncbi:conserved hypothetical protein [Microbacterium sp. C448]|uniref:glycosyltransferase n=1 Tax=Microbacterium sp. C448 TaxID=1177594 RepID=UPI0003DE0181|nr:glycosyltransferase [Microbacterium sp. C448]CDJ98887.1 conserved hypothetical protein [Microbacterium sp. C448]